MGQPDDPGATAVATPREGQVVLAGYESAIEHLASAGLVSRRQVGIVGYSRTGYYVQYAITHSSFPFAAAISADNVTQSYLEYVIQEGAFGRSENERVNGAAPYGEGLKFWLANAPGFNADKVATPLRMELNDGGLVNLLGQWELFSHLRNLGKPAELYVIPDIDHGSHGLLLPKQQLASLEGAVDWMDFWLNSNEEPGMHKAEQYRRWARLRNQKGTGSVNSP
jgi:dipeptidyl aminopeptidase/acylaminoacyl peptidase